MKVKRAELMLMMVDGSVKAWGWEFPYVNMTLGANTTLDGKIKNSDLRAEIFGRAFPMAVEDTMADDDRLELDAADVLEGEIVQDS